MLFTVLLTPPNPRFRERLRQILVAIAKPAPLADEGGAMYHFMVDDARVAEIREALRKDVEPWGAQITERE